MVDVCFFGDSVLSGMGDETGDGWVTRLVRSERPLGQLRRSFALGVPGERAASLLGRLRWEAEARLGGSDNPACRSALVLQFGHGDLVDLDGAGEPNDLMSILADAEQVVHEALACRSVYWIGPTIPAVDAGAVPWPSTDASDGWRGRVRADWVKALNRAFSSSAHRMGVPYLDLSRALANRPEWDAALTLGDGIHPNGPGHQAIADAVAAWAPWRSLMGDAQPDPKQAHDRGFQPLRVVGGLLG